MRQQEIVVFRCKDVTLEQIVIRRGVKRRTRASIGYCGG
jgi:hypothetical protein